MLKSQKFVADMLGCSPSEITLIAVTQHNQAPDGYRPAMSPTAYFKIDGANAESKFVSCHLFNPASIRTETTDSIAQALWKSENQRFNPDYPEVSPPLDEIWLAPQAIEKMGISLTSSLTNYEVLVGIPGRYNGIDREKGDHVVTSYIAGGDHDILMKNASHIRFR